MDARSSQFQPGKNSTVAIDGAFTASNTGALISRDNYGETYSFQIGTFSGSTPVLDITGLTSASPTPTACRSTTSPGRDRRDDHLHALRQHPFRQAPTGGAQLLEIYSKTLYLSSSGCTFGKNGDNNFAAKAVTLIGNGTGDGETRAIFGGTTCQSNSGAGPAAARTRSASRRRSRTTTATETASPTAAPPAPTARSSSSCAPPRTTRRGPSSGCRPRRSTGTPSPTTRPTWRSTTAAAKDVIYVRDETGTRSIPGRANAGETITGTPQWNSVTAGGVTTHYLFVATSAGQRLQATGWSTRRPATRPARSPSTPSPPAGQARNPFPCSCTISTPLGSMDASNLYWGSTTSGKNFRTLGAGDAVGAR